ncbi:hypothetical protein Sa4125_26970 [Aureimonas sp. SA4125]|nr:hypothetical protein Sa4125_26970 [Aureimonas sp. SA4125]
MPVPAGMDEDIDAFADMRYRLARRTRSARIGGHRGGGLGGDGRFHGLAPLVDHPDPRHIDMSATIRDPGGNVFVRRFRQPACATVYALLDLSASMGLVGRVDRFALASLLVAGLARMVRRSGDRFGLIAAGGAARDPSHFQTPEPSLGPNTGAPPGPDLTVPANRRSDLPGELRRALGERRPAGQGIAPLIDTARENLPRRPTLVFLVSDFQFETADLARLLGDLSLHDVRPILLRDSLAENPPQRFGFARLRDAETGRSRTILTRRATLARWQEESSRHLSAVRSTFAQHGLSPIEIVDQIDVDGFFEALAAQGIVS